MIRVVSVSLLVCVLASVSGVCAGALPLEQPEILSPDDNTPIETDWKGWPEGPDQEGPVRLLDHTSGNTGHASAPSSGPAEPEPFMDEAERYRLGHTAIEAAQYAKGIELLTPLAAMEPPGPYSAQASLEIVFALYKNGQHAKAAAVADHTLATHGRFPGADYAYYLKGLALLRGTLATTDPLRRGSGMRQTYETLMELGRQYPETPYKANAARIVDYTLYQIAQTDRSTAQTEMKKPEVASMLALARGEFDLVNSGGPSAETPLTFTPSTVASTSSREEMDRASLFAPASSNTPETSATVAAAQPAPEQIAPKSAPAAPVSKPVETASPPAGAAVASAAATAASALPPVSASAATAASVARELTPERTIPKSAPATPVAKPAESAAAPVTTTVATIAPVTEKTAPAQAAPKPAPVAAPASKSAEPTITPITTVASAPASMAVPTPAASAATTQTPAAAPPAVVALVSPKPAPVTESTSSAIDSGRGAAIEAAAAAVLAEPTAAPVFVRDELWFLTQNPKLYTVELQSAGQLETLQYMATTRGMKDVAQYYSVTDPSAGQIKGLYILVSGIYPDLAAASAAARDWAFRHGITYPRVRRISEIQGDIVRTARALSPYKNKK